MRDLFYLSLQYARHHRTKLAVLTAAITLACWLPLAIQSVVDQTARQLLARADNTPLVIGAPGSPLELSLGSLYFKSRNQATLPFNELDRLVQTGHARGIPLYYRFRAQDHPIVGTTPEYFSFRKLQLAQGRLPAILGEAVIGANVARAMKLSLGDSVTSSAESVFDLAGVYPLKMKVVGIIAPSLGPDDDAVFVDLKTTWVIQGLGHGHQGLNRQDAVGQILKREGDNIVANASVRQYNEITPHNLDSFHFHGDLSGHPISAIIPLPQSDKSRALLLGHYLEEREDVQIVRSQRVIAELLDTVFTVRNYIITGIALVAVATALVAMLVFYLSLRLRQGERFTLARIGASRLQITALMATEVLVVTILGVALSTLLALLTSQFGLALMQQLIMS